MSEEYPSNSNKAREASLIRAEETPHKETETPKQSQASDVIETEARPLRSRDISLAKQVLSAIFPGGMAEIRDRLIWDYAVPQIKAFLHGGWNDAGDAIFGNQGIQRTSNVSYDRAYRPQRLISRSTSASNLRGNEWAYQEVVWSTRTDAQSKLNELADLLRRYNSITLLDYNEIMGLETRSTDPNYGWISLSTAKVERSYDGWVVVLPRPIQFC